jgi:hypothetical protein
MIAGQRLLIVIFRLWNVKQSCVFSGLLCRTGPMVLGRAVVLACHEREKKPMSGSNQARPDRQGQVSFSAFMDHATHRAFKMLAVEEGTTSVALLHEAVAYSLVRHGSLPDRPSLPKEHHRPVPARQCQRRRNARREPRSLIHTIWACGPHRSRAVCRNQDLGKRGGAELPHITVLRHSAARFLRPKILTAGHSQLPGLD